ncbi:MAG: HTH-type transcriptional activator IlvY [Gammaproteobacteria bacterium]|jgi:LysR family positive regulator for ilvC|nr:HTH-type transcriptional activator IlvY [Gammaproteobacteria bacterium]MDH5172585.1 HTH-type transcriptional activator IlvY [Gammaproteobacteria bacterium]
MDTRALSVFLSVADTLNFSRSGELLHMSVSAVSRTIRRLEDELGQPLLERDNRRVRLTGAGREFREYARRSIADWQRLQRKLGSGGQLAGEVSLYCSVTATYSVLAPILEAFRSAHPAVEIMMHTGDQADGISRVLAGQDDVAVSGRPVQLPQRLDFLPLLESPLQLWAPAAECAVRQSVDAGDTASPGFDWGSIPFIVPERGITKEILDTWLRDRGIRPRVYAQVAGHEAIIAMVSLGLGIGIAPELVVEASGLARRVSRLALPEGLPPLAVGLCSLKQRLLSPLVKSLWDVAGQTYGVQV